MSANMAPIPILGPLASLLIRLVLSSRLLLTLTVVYAWVGVLPVLGGVRRLGHWVASVSGDLSLLLVSNSSSITSTKSSRSRTKSFRRRPPPPPPPPPVARQRTLSLASSTAIPADSSPLSPPPTQLPPPNPSLAPQPPRRTRKRSSTSARIGATTASTITTQTHTHTHTHTLRPLQHHSHAHHDLDDSITTSTSITATLPHIPPLSILRTPSSHFASPSSPSWPFPERYFLLANNLRVHYIDVAPPMRPAASSASASSPLKTVVLVHGVLGYSASAFAKHVPIMLDLGYRVIALDFPGHGKSDKPLDVHQAHTFGLYVTALVDLFAHVFNTADQAAAGPVAVVAQGVAATFVSLALAASPLVAKLVTHLVLASPYAPPANTKRDALVHVLGARAAARLVHVLPAWCTPSMHTVARAVGATSSRDDGWDVPGTSVAVPLTVLGRFPVPYLADVPTERVLALFDVPEARAAAAAGVGRAPALVGSVDPPGGGGGGWASPGQASFDSAVAGVSAAHAHKPHASDVPSSVSNRIVALVVRAICALARIADRATALDLKAAHLHLREWAHSPPPPPPPPTLSSSPMSSSPPLPPPRRQILVLYGTKDALVGGGKCAAEQWARASDAQRVLGVRGVGALVGGEGAVACVDAVCEFLDASVGG